ncbi:hypothetical protein [Arthrobacter luteolus]|uniref:hypothetical protein n=1 Tax=Arthrobacter luteolus TaxID=98672 RepID=UPI00124DE95D|nr:hypothetical protein [Arthrobacter luteolus]
MNIEQNVTEVDIQNGRIRCGVKVKPDLPHARGEVEILLMGTRLLARYDPRNGPDRQRSGVLKIGREEMRSLIGEPRTLTFRLNKDMPEFS